MDSQSRRQFLYAGLQEKQRRQRFAAGATKADLDALQKSLRETFLKRLDGLPARPSELLV